MAETIKLSRQFGLIEEIPIKGNDNCEFSHLLVVDFESTCSRDHRIQPEIIEFPAVLLDLATGNIIAEFHEFVSPTEIPKLTEFCIKLTGITQDQVESSMPLKTCLLLFQQWYSSLKEKYQTKVIALVSWSDWDFGVCLNQECKRKNIKKPDVFNQWIDLRALYKEHTQKPSRGLKAAVEEVGLTFVGREHSGIWDARNTAKLAWQLHSNGACKKQAEQVFEEEWRKSRQNYVAGRNTK